MNEAGIGSRRTVLPRWRPLARTPEHELPSGRARHEQRLNVASLDRAERRWVAEPTVENAVELFESALVTSNNVKATAAATWLRAQATQLTEPLESAIARVLDPATNEVELTMGLGTQGIRCQIAEFKQRMLIAPRDAVSACELARLYTVNGQNAKAGDWLRRAISLSPNDRYILRSAAQFYTHIGEPEEGLELIWRSDAVRHDPWVQAAEVAVADSAGRSPKWALKRGDAAERQTLISRSELTTGLASFHEKLGAKRRFIRNLLSSGLENPTENALAQAIWIRAEKGIVVDDRRLLLTDFEANEAQARQRMEQEDYKEALSYMLRWIEDEPYSVPALQMAGMCSSTYMGDPERGVKFYQAALRLSPTAPLVINGLLVAKAYLGDLEEATQLFSRLEMFRGESAMMPYVHAARGLIAYRSGAPEAGRQAYQEAIAAGDGIDGGNLKFTAMIFWIEQEFITFNLEDKVFQQVAALMDGRLAEIKTLAGIRARKLWNARKAILARTLRQMREPYLEGPPHAATVGGRVLKKAITQHL